MTLKTALTALFIASAQTAAAGSHNTDVLRDVGDSVAMVLATEPARSMLPGLMGYFPAEGMAMIDALRALLSGPDPLSPANLERLGAVNAQTQAAILALVAQAPDADLVALLDDQIGMLRGLQGQPLLCARMVAQGPGALGSDHRYVTGGTLEEAFRHRFAVAYENRATPARRAPASDADFAAFGSALVAMGADDAWFDRVEAMDPTDPALCRSVTEYMTTARDGTFSGADRIRAEIVTVMGLY
jgi:hypothetical protein